MKPLAPLGLLTLLAAASAAGVSAPPPPVSIPFEKFELANGLQVVLVEDRRLPLVATNLRFDVGSAQDPPGRTGFAHLFEHLYAFSPPDGLPSLQEAGATQDGATTDPDRTTYYTTIPSHRLELYLALESDRHLRFLERLDERLLTRERSNVRNERRMVVENEPYGLADEALFRELFPAGHPYHWKYVGSHADIEAVSLEEARRFYAQYYGPDNASLVIAGDIDRASTRALVERYFGAIPKGDPKPSPMTVTPPAGGARRVTVTDRIELPRVSVAWRTPGWYRPGHAEAELLAVVLGSGASSRLQTRLVQELRLAQKVLVEHLPFTRDSVLVVKATANPGVGLRVLESAIEEVIEAVRRTGPTDAEVAQARNTVELQVVRGLEKLGEITAFGDYTGDGSYGGVAEQLNQCNQLLGDPGCLPSVLQAYRGVSGESLREFARSTLSPDTRITIDAVPGEKVVEDGAAVADASVPAGAASVHEATRFTAPPPGVASEIQLPVARRFSLPNGLTVLWAEQRHLPVVATQLIVRSGSASSPADRPGLAAFTIDMLVRGTKRRSAVQIARQAAALGTSLDTDISSDAAALNIRVLRDNLEPAFELLADVAIGATFPQEELESLRADRLARLALLRSNPDMVASRAFTEALYAAGSPYHASGLFNEELFARTHRYGYEEPGTEESLRALRRSDLLSMRKHGYVPGNAALVVTGDVDEARVKDLATKYFGSWSGKPAAGHPPRGGKATHPGVFVVDLGESSQTALRVGSVGLSRGDPDHVAARMLNIVFGELYGSRITTNLRGRHGYTYMVRSQFAMRREPGPFVIGTHVRTDATAAAAQELFGEIARIRATPVTEDELQFARNAYSSSLVGMFQTTVSTATGLGQLFTYGLPLDYYGSLPQRISGTSSAELQRAALRLLDPRAMVVVAAGDRSEVEPGLRQLGLGAVRVLDAR